jgi:hypothetical protein
MSKFNELIDALYEENSKKKKEKKVKTAFPFSKAKKAELTRGLLNDPDYEAEIVKYKDGAFVTETIKPVAEFRKQFIGKVLRDNGIDAQQAEHAVQHYEYSQKQAEAFYPVVAEDVETFMRLGYAYELGKKKDFNGAIYMRDVEGGEKVYHDPSTGKEIKTRIDPHKVIVKKGGAPRICKHRVDK